MKDVCKQAVREAVGRDFTDAEFQKIENRIAKEVRRLGPEATKMSPEQRYHAAAARAAEGFLAEHALKEKRDALAVLKRSQIDDTLRSFDGDKIAGLQHVLAFYADGKGSAMSVESRGDAIRADAFRQMLGTLEASNPKFFGLLENPEGVRKLIRELWAEGTGDGDAKEGAKQFQAVADQLRERFNDGGGQIREREDWHHPYHHSQRRVAEVDAASWTAVVLPRLKREAFYNEDGSRMTDGQLQEFLAEVHLTIATGGVNGLEPGQMGQAMRANYHAAARSLHFKNADAWMEYQKEFGELSLYDVMTQHIKGLSESIAMVETFGPNPDHAFSVLRDQAYQEAILKEPAKRGAVEKKIASLDNLYDYVSGNTQPVASQRLADGFDTLRKWLAASRLGSAFISSIPDMGTMRVTAHVNHLDQMQLFRNELATLDPTNATEKRLAQRAGLALNTTIGYLNRFGDESMRNTLASKAASFTMRASGLNAITEARRRGFGVTMMSSLGHLTRERDFGALDAGDHRLLLSKGVTATDWGVWKLAQAEDWGHGNDAMLTPESVYRVSDEALAHLVAPESSPQQVRRDAATRLLGAVLEETNMAVVEPGARERAMLYGGAQRGTWKGELMRSVWLFKTMPVAMMVRHWERGMGMPDAQSRAGYVAAMVVSTTVLGMAALQIDEMLKGRDPVNVNPFEGKAGARNWARAMLKGGSLGIYGDFLLNTNTQYGSSPVASFLGPVVGLGEDAFNLTQGNFVRALKDEKTHAGAELLKFGKGLTPLGNLWYTKAATDHLIFNQLQELISPGYLSRMKQRAQKDFGQSFYWDPASATPDRAPNAAAAIGGR